MQNVQRFYSVLHFTAKVDFSKMRITQYPKMSFCLLSSLHVETNTSISLWINLLLAFYNKLLYEKEMVENLTYFGLPQDFCGARVAQSFVLCVMSCISLFILLSPFLCFNLCLSGMLDSLSCSFTSISFLTTRCSFTLICV